MPSLIGSRPPRTRRLGDGGCKTGCLLALTPLGGRGGVGWEWSGEAGGRWLGVTSCPMVTSLDTNILRDLINPRQGSPPGRGLGSGLCTLISAARWERLCQPEEVSQSVSLASHRPVDVPSDPGI